MKNKYYLTSQQCQTKNKHHQKVKGHHMKNNHWEKAVGDSTIEAIQNIFVTQGQIQKPTSIWAKASVDILSIEEKILCELLILESTDDELEQRMEMRHQTVSACRRGLVKKEFAVATGKTRPTRSGRHANVWRLTDAGRIRAKEIVNAKVK